MRATDANVVLCYFKSAGGCAELCAWHVYYGDADGFNDWFIFSIFTFVVKRTRTKRRVFSIKALARLFWNNIKISISTYVHNPTRCSVYYYAVVCFILGKKLQPIYIYIHAPPVVWRNLWIPTNPTALCRAHSSSTQHRKLWNKREEFFGFLVAPWNFTERWAERTKRCLGCFMMPLSTPDRILLQKRFILFPLSLSKLKQKLLHFLSWRALVPKRWDYFLKCYLKLGVSEQVFPLILCRP